MPGTRAVARGFMEDMKAAGQEKDGAAAFGQGARAMVRGAFALPLGVVKDTIEPWTRAAQPVLRGTVNAANTAITGDSKPLIAPPTTQSAAPVAAAPKPEGIDNNALAASEAYNRANSLRRSQDLTNVRVERQANGNLSFSSENTVGDPSYKGGAASALRNPGNRLSVVDGKNFATTPSMEQTEALSAARLAAAQRGDWDAVKASYGEAPQGGGAPAIIVPDTGGFGLLDKNRQKDDMPEVGDVGWRTARQLANERRGQDITARGQDITSRGQDLNYDATIKGHGVSLRGQDLNYDSAMTGHLMGQKSAVARLKYDMSKDQRDFAAGRADKNFEQRKAREEQLDKQLEGRFLDAEGKRQPQMEYEYKQFMQNGIADAAKQLMASKDPQQQALGKALQGRSYADLDPQDLQGLEQAWQMRDKLKEGAGELITQWLMNKGRFVDSLHPNSYAPNGEEERTLGGNHITTRGGSTGSVNDLRNSPFGMFPAGTDMFEDQIRTAHDIYETQRAKKLREGY